MDIWGIEKSLTQPITMHSSNFQTKIVQSKIYVLCNSWDVNTFLPDKHSGPFIAINSPLRYESNKRNREMLGTLTCMQD